MLKVVLQYTDCLQDGRNFFSVLAENPVIILKSRKVFCSIEVNVTVLVPGFPELNELIGKLNQRCNYEVRVVKVKQLKENNK